MRRGGVPLNRSSLLHNPFGAGASRSYHDLPYPLSFGDEAQKLLFSEVVEETYPRSYGITRFVPTSDVISPREKRG